MPAMRRDDGPTACAALATAASTIRRPRFIGLRITRCEFGLNAVEIGLLDQDGDGNRNYRRLAKTADLIRRETPTCEVWQRLIKWADEEARSARLSCEISITVSGRSGDHVGDVDCRRAGQLAQLSPHAARVVAVSVRALN